MDLKEFCESGIQLAEWGIANEKLGGNIIKEAHWKGEFAAYQAVLSVLLELESTEKSPNTTKAEIYQSLAEDVWGWLYCMDQGEVLPNEGTFTIEGLKSIIADKLSAICNPLFAIDCSFKL